MPELFRAYGFTFLFFSREHEPIHIHVIGNNGDAKFEWNGSKFYLTELHNIKVNDLKKIKEMINSNSDLIILQWKKRFEQ